MMKSFQLSYFQLLYLLIAALFECIAQTQGHCKQIHQLNINTVQGDNMSISCLTTTHPLESLTVKLLKSNQDKLILMYSDSYPASEHQRWSVRKQAGSVALDLKGIKSSDNGSYDCQVYKDQDCLQATQFNLSSIKCKGLDSVYSTPGSSVLLPCSEHPLQNKTEQVTWKVVNGHQSTDIFQYRHPNKPSSSTEKPFYERARQLKNGSLLIRDAVLADGLWYQCRVNDKTCYEVRLVMKVHSTSTKEPLESTASVVSRVGQTKINSNKSESVTTNSTVVVVTTIVCLCILISLTVCVILYFQKQRSKTNSQTQLNGRFSVYYSQAGDGFDVPFYSLIKHNTATMTTFGAEPSEAPALKQDGMYEIFAL